MTQFEPIAARQAFPGFDEPVFKVPFDISIISHADDSTITNTPEESSESHKLCGVIKSRDSPSALAK